MVALHQNIMTTSPGGESVGGCPDEARAYPGIDLLKPQYLTNTRCTQEALPEIER